MYGTFKLDGEAKDFLVKISRQSYDTTFAKRASRLYILSVSSFLVNVHSDDDDAIKKEK
jgi:hypothetical protein